jgi:imidazole glycerol-phosphate synthase subunit HisF
MIKIRIIPTMLLKNFGLVKGVKFNSWRRVGTVLPALNVYNSRDVDELILVDISATQEHRNFLSENITDVADNCFIPLTVGGGIGKLDAAKDLIENGSDKISINTSIFTNPDVLTEIANIYGSQAIVASLDVRKIDDKHICFSKSGNENTKKNIIDICKKVESLGAGEILLTSIDKDGTLDGYDYRVLETVSNLVNIPVIAAGGAGKPEHMLKAITECGVSAVAGASIFHFTETTPNDIKEYLSKNNIPVRK